MFALYTNGKELIHINFMSQLLYNATVVARKNVDDAKVHHFGIKKKHKAISPPFLMNNEPIKEVSSQKHLGIFLSKDGT